MKTSTTFDENDIEIASILFCKDGNEIRFESYPRRIVYRGREYLLA